MEVHLKQRISRIIVAGALGLFNVVPAVAEDNTDREFEYAARLIELGLCDYAEMVADRIVAEHPDQKDRADVIRAEALIALRKFEQAEAIVAAMPQDSAKAQAIRLAMADGYFKIGEQEKCNALYNNFFNQYTNKVPDDPDLLRFYRDAAHKFAQMLAMKDDAKGAAAIYDLVLKALEKNEEKRQIWVEQAEMLLRAAQSLPDKERNEALEKAKGDCENVIWGGMDLWFGRAVATLAQIEIARGRKDDAEKLLKSNLSMLKKLDETLKEANVPVSESPFASARSLLGRLYKEDAQLVLGDQPARETEAIRVFERALVEFQNVWNLIVKMNKYDAVVVERAKDKSPSEVLTGAKATREQPFHDMLAALKKFESVIAEYSSGQGWSQAVSQNANAFKQKLQDLMNTIVEYPKEIGVTPSPDMSVGEAFRGWEYVKRARAILGDQESRKELGIQTYTKSLQQYYNVFAGYSGTEWSKQAAKEVTTLKETLEGLTGKEVTISAKGASLEKIASVKFKEGDSLMARKEYDKAAEQYLDGLNQLPEDEKSVLALANLMECYIRLKDAAHTKTVALYLSERFTDNPQAAQGMLRAGRLYFDEQNREMFTYMYERYLKQFPKDPAAASILYMLGEQRWGVKDYNGAVPYYVRVKKEYQGSPYFLKALNRIGWSHYLGQDYENATETFAECIAEAQPGEVKAQAKLCMADSHRQLKQHSKALNHYRELAKWLLEKDSHYVQYKQNYRGILEQAVFFQASCLSMLDEPAEKVPAFREAAVGLYRNFVHEFPESQLAPWALSSMGATLMAQDKSDEAVKAYEDLAARYPNSEPGQDARFARIKGLIDIGRAKDAETVLSEMLGDAKSYKMEQFLRAGRLMLENKLNESAALAFAEALKGIKASADKSKEHAAMEQRVLLNLAEAQYAVSNYTETVNNMNDLITRYPTSGLFYEARFLLGRAYKESGRPDEAAEALTDVFKRATDQNLINKATIELAAIQLAQGNTTDALASCQRIVLLSSPDDQQTRPLYEEALINSIRIFMDAQRWTEAIENCDKYKANFPLGKYIVDVSNLRSKAAMQLAM